MDDGIGVEMWDWRSGDTGRIVRGNYVVRETLQSVVPSGAPAHQLQQSQTSLSIDHSGAPNPSPSHAKELRAHHPAAKQHERTAMWDRQSGGECSMPILVLAPLIQDIQIPTIPSFPALPGHTIYAQVIPTGCISPEYWRTGVA